MKCPTCKDAEEGKCCRCGDEIPIELQKLEPDPYSDEIEGDDSLHLECRQCSYESARDI